jgi:hypothetical protein
MKTNNQPRIDDSVRQHRTPASPLNAIKAHQQAERDIAKDADLSLHSKNDDLDEGELARLGGDKNDLA